MKRNYRYVALAVLCVGGTAFAGGGVKGKVLFDGSEIPARKDLSTDIEKHQDKDICHAGDMKGEDLIVDAGTKGILNVFVSIEKVKGGKKLEAPAEPIVSDQKSCRFEPHIMVVPKGSKVELKNSDSKLHNTHSWSQKNTPFNEGIPAGKSIVKDFKDNEKVKLTCDVHPWMTGYIVVTDTPYYALSAQDGAFEIKDLPPGEYTIKFWHETLGLSKADVKIEEGKTAEVTQKMAPKGSG